MPKIRVYVTKVGYYEVTAKDEDEAYEKAHNGIPEPIFHVEDEVTNSIEIIRRPLLQRGKKCTTDC